MADTALRATLWDFVLGLWRKAPPLPPLDAIPWPALVIEAGGTVLATNAAAEPLARVLGTGGLPDLRRRAVAAAWADAGTATEVAFVDQGTPVTYDVTLVPLGRERVLVLARGGALDRNLREALVDSRRRYKDLVEVSSDSLGRPAPMVCSCSSRRAGRSAGRRMSWSAAGRKSSWSFVTTPTA